MTISLTSEQQALLTRLVESGRFASETEAVGEALKLLEEEARFLDETGRRIETGIAESDRGEAVPFDQALADRIKAEGRERLAARKDRTSA